MIRGTLAASVTPLNPSGSDIDEDHIPEIIDLLSNAGLAGVLAMGTSGEGMLLKLEERLRVADAFVAAGRDRLKVIVHAGAQSTRDTAQLAEHAALIGADGVAVIAPPYFRLDDLALLAHLRAAASACAPVPFYLYEYTEVSGYPLPVKVIHELREHAPNLVGLKVSNEPWERFAPYLLDGLDVFVGKEVLIAQAMEAGAAGAVSALAAALPELVERAVSSGEPELSARLGELRQVVERYPRHSGLKHILAMRGLGLNESTRRPLRGLTAAETDSFEAGVRDFISEATSLSASA
jgi:dihydrodipicolinate synthase/N-acetylneuraminate lyase